MAATGKRVVPISFVVWHPVNKAWNCARLQCTHDAKALTKSAMQTRDYDAKSLLRTLSPEDKVTIILMSRVPCSCGSSDTSAVDTICISFDRNDVADAVQVIRGYSCANPLCLNETTRICKTATQHIKKTIMRIKCCTACKKDEGKLRLCGGCGLVYYCSIACQRNDRKNHAMTCFDIVRPLETDETKHPLVYALYCWRDDRMGLVAMPKFLIMVDKADAMKDVVVRTLDKLPENLGLSDLTTLEGWSRRCFCGSHPITAPFVKNSHFYMVLGDADGKVHRLSLFFAYTCQDVRCIAGWIGVSQRMCDEAQEASRIVRICAMCQFIPQRTMSKCSICMRTYYCSIECQKKDWKEHRKICVPHSQ